MLRVKFSIVISAVAIASAVAGASAATVDLAFTGVNPGQIESVSTSPPGNFNDENTGQFNFNVSNKSVGVDAIIPGSTVASWCIELSQFVDNGSNTYSVLGPGFGSYTAQFGNSAAIAAFFNQFYSTSFSQTDATAFQLDIWELEFDSTPGSLSTGTFQVAGSDAAVTEANGWLSTFNSATVGPWVLYQLHNDSLQDQIFAVEGGGAGQNPTPLPASLVGGLSLIGGLGIIAKLRRLRTA